MEFERSLVIYFPQHSGTPTSHLSTEKTDPTRNLVRGFVENFGRIYFLRTASFNVQISSLELVCLILILPGSSVSTI